MKPNIHPDYGPVVSQDRNTGKQFLMQSTATSEHTTTWEDGGTYPLVVVDVSADSHPFWTGTQQVLDTEGRVEKFRRRYGGRTR